MNHIRIRPFRAGQITQWLSCGYRFWRRRPLGNTLPSAMLAAFMLVLQAIPILGDVALLLLLPSVLSSALLHVHRASKPEAAPTPAARGRVRKPPARERLGAWWKETAQVWFAAWSRQANIFPLLVIGFVLVVLGLLAHVMVSKIGGQSLASPYAFSELNTTQQARLLMAYLSGILFWMAIGMTQIWALPLFVIRDQNLVSAQALGLRAMTQNMGIVAVLFLLLAALLVPGMLARIESPLLGMVLLWLGITLLLNMVTFCGYCSYRLVFAEDTGHRVPANNPAAAPQPIRKPL